LFSAVISEQATKNRMIISVVAAKIWYLKNVRFLLSHPVNNNMNVYNLQGAHYRVYHLDAIVHVTLGEDNFVIYQ